MPAPDSSFVEASAEVILEPGSKIAGTAFERLTTRPHTIQRIGPRTWWVEVALYHAAVVVGEDGVLVFDPLSGGRAEGLLAAIGTLTDKRVSHLAYSHHHIDHIGDAPAFVAAAGERGTELEIVATDATAEMIAERRLDVPAATRVVPANGPWRFEDIVVETTTPVSGHTRDNAIFVLPQERVAHCVDLVHPGMVEFDCFGLAESLAGYDDAVRQLRDLAGWEILCAGHGNVGGRADVAATAEYLAQMRRLAWDAMSEADFGAGVSPDTMPWDWLHAHRDAVVERVVAGMRDEWGDVPGFERCAPNHAATVYWEFSLTWAGPGS
jgi:glyoxylase-like metal-dependent hydrolase (beta-lactamase superfamily II)